MPRTVLSCITAAAILAGTASGPAMAQGVAGEGAWPGSVSFDQQVLAYLEKHNLPGATVAVTKGGQLVLSKGYGLANIANQTQMQPTHKTYIGSVSKVITVMAALKLTEDGQLGLLQRVYGTATPVWGAPGATPGLKLEAKGALKDQRDYFRAMVRGVNNLDPNFPPAEGPSPTMLGLALYKATMERTLAWASEMQLKHLMSHTSGLLRSGSSSVAADHFDEDEGDISYKQIHLAMLEAAKGPPFEFEPGTARAYSNHGFGLLGHIVSETSGQSFEQFVRQRILQPLGLSGIVRGGTHTAQYATPYGKEDHPLIKGAWVPKPMSEFKVSTTGLAAGGWAATARDLVRLMCGMDKETTLPILKPATVAWMEAIAYPKVDSNQPLGWDNRSGGRLVKNGLTGAGGMAQIAKFLPGALGSAEINIAFAINIKHNPDGIVAFLQTLAQIVAQESIPESYDLFDPAFRCRKPATPSVKLGVPTRAIPAPLAEPAIACVGGTVRKGRCVCGKGSVPVAAGANAFRCGSAVLPKSQSSTPSSDAVAPLAG